jgi:type VI secretion system protein ImpK
MSPSTAMRRPENLALLYQEVLTAVVRLRANPQGVTDANAFRHHTREALKTAASQALGVGYPQDDVRLATFATVAFLDESVLNSRSPNFADWLRQPLQEELFGTHIAGEVFFQNLEQLLGRTDSQDLADVLEVHYLCLLLGFGGRYSAGNRGELSQVMNMTGEKIRRIRGHFGPLSPAWAPPPGAGRSRKDPWVRRLAIAAIVCAGLMALLFVVYKLVLSGGAQVSGAGFQPAVPAFFRGAPSRDAGKMPAWQAGSLLYGGRRA